MASDRPNLAATEPIDLPAGVVRSADGFDVALTVRAAVRLRDTPVDRAAYERAFSEGHPLSRALRTHRDILRRALADAATSLPPTEAAELIADPPSTAIGRALRRELFAIGVELAADATVTADAPALRERDAKLAAAEAMRAQGEHAASLLAAFEEIRRQNPDVPPGKLLASLPKDDQRPTLMKLLEAEAERDSATPLVAAGSSLFAWQSDELEPFAESPGEQGPIRRVMPRTIGGERVLLAGTRDGITVWPIDRPDEPRSRVAQAIGDGGGLGFSLVETWPRQVKGEACDWYWVAHPEHGVTGTLVRRGGSFGGAALRAMDLTPRVIGVGPIKAMAAAGRGAVVFAGGRKLYLLPSDEGGFEESGRAEADAEVIALLHRREADGLDATPKLVAVLASGDVRPLVLHPPDHDHPAIAICPSDGGLGREVTRATVVPWLGDVRVAACVRNGPVVIGGVDDGITVEYQSSHAGFAEVAASAGRVAAITGDRQRLVVWRLDRPERPILDVHLLDRTRTRLADVAFA